MSPLHASAANGRAASPREALSATLGALRRELDVLRPTLESRVSALRCGSLASHPGVWMNAAAACPVPDSVIRELSEGLALPHLTLDRGADSLGRELRALYDGQIAWFCSRYCEGRGTLLIGQNTTHVLLALGRALVQSPGAERVTIAHGEADHRASYALSSLPGWQKRTLIPYTEGGFYERHTLKSLPERTVLLLNVLHHLYGTAQTDALSSISPQLEVLLDLSQALTVMSADELSPFTQRASAAVFNLGKLFSPLSMGILWVRDPALAERVLLANPELTGSISSAEVRCLASVGAFVSASIDRDWCDYVHKLTRYALASLTSLEHVSLLGCSSWASDGARRGIVSFTVAGMSPQELGLYLDSQGFAVRADGSCTGPDPRSTRYECVRVSLLPHVSAQDVDALVAALRSCA